MPSTLGKKVSVNKAIRIMGDWAKNFGLAFVLDFGFTPSPRGRGLKINFLALSKI
jgi:hypothetical protein